MNLIQLTDRVWYTTFDEKTDRPALGYLRGDRFSMAVDAGNSAAHVAEFYSLLEQNHLPLPQLTAITHWHWDHTFGMHAVNGLTVACADTAAMLTRVTKWRWDEQSMQQRLQSGEDIEFCDTFIRVEYPDRSKIRVVTPDIVLDSTVVVDLGGLECRLIVTGSPHCDDNLLVHLPEEGCIFVGDASGGDMYHNDGYCKPEKVRSFIALLEGLPFSHFIFSHCPLQTRAESFSGLNESLAEAR